MSSQNGNWVCQETESPGVISSDGNRVTVTDGDHFAGGAVYTALYKSDNNEDLVYWKFTIETDCNPFVGLTTEEAFGPGYGNTSFQYGGPGNLSDGGCLLVGSFGQSVKRGDKVVLVREYIEDTLRIYVIHNEKCLGLAFDIPSPAPRPVHPTVSMSGSGTITVEKLDSSVVSDFRCRVDEPFKGFLGNWKLEEFVEDGNNTGISGYKMRLFGDEENETRISFRVINSMGGYILKTDKGYEMGPLCTTLMGGPPEMMRHESQCSGFLHKVNDLQHDGQSLTLRSPSGHMKFTRYQVPPPEAYKKNVIAERN